jgi:hypothetical protein
MGQKLMKLVRIKMPDNTSNTMARVPEIRFAKYSIPITTAIRILTALSILPMFGFI